MLKLTEMDKRKRRDGKMKAILAFVCGQAISFFQPVVVFFLIEKRVAS